MTVLISFDDAEEADELEGHLASDLWDRPEETPFCMNCYHHGCEPKSKLIASGCCSPECLVKRILES